ALFFLMQFLIAMDAEQPERGEAVRIADITMPEIELEVQRIQPKPQQPEEIEELPELPEPTLSIDAPTTGGIQLGQVEIDVGAMGGDASISSFDSEYLPIVV